MSTKMIGPFIEHYKVSVDGYVVPRLEYFPCKDENDGAGVLVLDGRFSVEATECEVERWAWIISNAMAIGAGYSCHGANSVVYNPYGTQMAEIKTK